MADKPMDSKKIKILYTIPNFDTAGSGKVVYDLVKHIDKDQFEPHIACFHSEGTFFEKVKKLGVPIHIIPFAIPYRPFINFPFRLWSIIRFFKKHKFDLIHSWHWSSDFSEPLAARIANIPFVYTKKNMGWGNKAWKWKSILSSEIIAINSDMLNIFFANYLGKVQHIPIGIDTGYFDASLLSKNNSIDFIKEKGDFVLITVSNLLPIKGIDLIIQAVNELNNSKIKLLIIGDDHSLYGDELKNKAKDNKSIFFMGRQFDVRPYINFADLFVIPSREMGEGLGVAPLEAMSLERIVIGSNVPGIRDVLKCFPDHLFDSENVEDLKNKILQIQKLDDDQKKAIQVKMREVIMHDFSLEKFIKSHIELYLKLAK